ncbi:hypothetical protein Hanom_Chr02g00164431 [Helianthus anomalus]
MPSSACLMRYRSLKGTIDCSSVTNTCPLIRWKFIIICSKFSLHWLQMHSTISTI